MRAEDVLIISCCYLASDSSNYCNKFRNDIVTVSTHTQSVSTDRGECRSLVDLATSGHVNVEFQNVHDLPGLPGPGHIALPSPLAQVLQDKFILYN